MGWFDGSATRKFENMGRGTWGRGRGLVMGILGDVGTLFL